MSEKIKKYNPANITPEHLFRPPTSGTHGELTYLTEQLSQALEGGGRVKNRLLLVGTELEVFFFSPELDPLEGSGLYDRDNPNYQRRHYEKIIKLQEFGEAIGRKNPSEFMYAEKMGKIFLEFRTTPQQVSQHLETMERFGDLLRAECKSLDVLPIVHSQHIHMSLRNNPLNLNMTFGDTTSGILPRVGMVKAAFSRITPLVLLPEEWWDRRLDPHYIKNDGVMPFVRRLDHPEFRMLSSEYACDPVLNLLVSLRAMYAGCVDDLSATSRIYYDDRYGVAVRQMGNDVELSNFFGRSTLTKLTNIIRQYPAVSRREITVDQVKQ